jgi:hypothetical protein
MDELDAILLSGSDDSDEEELGGMYDTEFGAKKKRRLEHGRFRSQYLPLGSVALLASGTGTLTGTPQKPFLPKRLMLQATSIVGLRVNGVVVGTQNQGVSSASAPGSAFANLAVGAGVDFDAAGPGVNVIVSLLDTSALANTVDGVFFGKSKG